MGYGDDDRFGGDRNRSRESSRMGYRDNQGRDNQGLGRSDYDRDRDRGGDDGRGFFERAGEQVRSWFGDEDGRPDRDSQYGRSESWRGDDSFGGGWGNQTPRQDRQPGRGPSTSQSQGGSRHDPHYSEWRSRQIEQIDRDYEEYRREHQSKFEQEFGGWREKRQGQRQHMGRATENMEVVGSDGEHIGTVDKIRGDRIILTKNDQNAGGIHHSIPCSWIESVDGKVCVNKTAAEAMNAWRDEERSRALFEREDQGSEGPHVLNRSFSGTYSDRDDR